MPRLHCSLPLHSGATLALPPEPARHVQVLRLQPGDAITLFDGRGGEYAATVTRMGRADVEVEVGAHDPVEREAPRALHLALGIPANERMDWLVEKATELGAASIQPLLAQRSVVRLQGERAQKRQAHWEGIAIAACEQSGRNRLPTIHPVLPLATWLQQQPAADARLLLSLRAASQGLLQAAGSGSALFLSGPEGGLAAEEEDLALAAGFTAVRLGPRVLRAETAPLAVLAALGLAGAAA